MYKKISGHLIADKLKSDLVKKIYKSNKLRPNLAIILLGDREDSKIYVNLKEKESKKVGIDKDELIDGILVQLPLPKKFDTDKIINSIDPDKDVDGFRLDHPDYIVSPVMAAIKASLNSIGFLGDNKKACILNNSQIFGQEIEKILKPFNLKIVKKDKLKEADLVITALGKPHYLKKEMLKKGVIIIDIGITKQENKVLGDADPVSLKNWASYITPVPGGIGPMTIAFLFKNVWEIYRRRHNL